jgi:hypothetical protein
MYIGIKTFNRTGNFAGVSTAPAAEILNAVTQGMMIGSTPANTAGGSVFPRGQTAPIVGPQTRARLNSGSKAAALKTLSGVKSVPILAQGPPARAGRTSRTAVTAHLIRNVPELKKNTITAPVRKPFGEKNIFHSQTAPFIAATSAPAIIPAVSSGPAIQNKTVRLVTDQRPKITGAVARSLEETKAVVLSQMGPGVPLAVPNNSRLNVNQTHTGPISTGERKEIVGNVVHNITGTPVKAPIMRRSMGTARVTPPIQSATGDPTIDAAISQTLRAGSGIAQLRASATPLQRRQALTDIAYGEAARTLAPEEFVHIEGGPRRQALTAIAYGEAARTLAPEEFVHIEGGPILTRVPVNIPIDPLRPKRSEVSFLYPVKPAPLEQQPPVTGTTTRDGYMGPQWNNSVLPGLQIPATNDTGQTVNLPPPVPISQVLTPGNSNVAPEVINQLTQGPDTVFSPANPAVPIVGRTGTPFDNEQAPAPGVAVRKSSFPWWLLLVAAYAVTRES